MLVALADGTEDAFVIRSRTPFALVTLGLVALAFGCGPITQIPGLATGGPSGLRNYLGPQGAAVTTAS